MTGEKLPKPTVLVVDDEPLIQWSLFESLSELGYQVCLASSGAEARQFLGGCNGNALVVVLDLRLPDVADLALLREVRRQAPRAPVIVMSAHGTPETRADSLALGATHFVDKPFDVATIATLVQDVWQGRSN